MLVAPIVFFIISNQDLFALRLEATLFRLFRMIKGVKWKTNLVFITYFVSYLVIREIIDKKQQQHARAALL
jgi:hypothetical protein